ncbi:MAG: hypothetical protein JXJ22_14790 [Bacteroidales bacterium]|nr:hypothetical protein [Bacteroidales bacterium]
MVTKYIFFKTKLAILSVFLMFLVTLISCEKSNSDVIPDTVVNITINVLDDPEYYMLRVANNAVKITRNFPGSFTGYNNNGIIVYNAGNEFYAFDCTCTYQVEKSISVFLGSLEGTAMCPECNSLFLLMNNGQPTNDGPAHFPLKNYKTYYSPSTGEIHIYN